MDLWKRNNSGGDLCLEKDVCPLQMRQMRQVLEKYACRHYGQEGRDWRIVQDSTLVGFHVKALVTGNGEILELR